MQRKLTRAEKVNRFKRKKARNEKNRGRAWHPRVVAP